jgi:hypothetical protein
MNRNYVVLSMMFVSVLARAEAPVNVLESTIKIGGLSEEVMYLAFAEGDQIVFNFHEEKRRELKELEIVEWPSSTKFSDFKTSSIVDKRIDVRHTSIYKFRFANSAIGGRVCKISIQRIPANPTSINFNTNVYWRTVNDTIHTPTQERYLIRSDTNITNVIDQVTKVSSTSAINGNSNTTVTDIDLPDGTVAWSYYIGVGTEGRQAFAAATDKFANNAVKTFSKIEGYGTMAALAIYGLNLIAQVQGRDNVKYWLIPDWNNVQLFQSRQPFQMYKGGDVINEAARMTTPIAGKIYLGLFNDNLIEPIEVVVKVTAIEIREQWGVRIVNKTSINQRTEPFVK